jgi:signal-transduction protein with cAMP-binding, CBS, and nucleotidyltransferase domain
VASLVILIAFSATLDAPCCFFHLVVICYGAYLRESGRERAMSKLGEQELATLLSSKNGLAYLTLNDWTLIADKASRVHFKEGDTLVQKGKRVNGVFLLLKGTAKVQLPSQPSVRKIGPGEICGEMSFLDDVPASANVIADEQIEACHLDRPTLQSLFELFPHMGSRFYRSLATNLSHRLRDLIGMDIEPSTASRKSSG